MASRQLIVLALVVFAVVGMASAAGSDPAPKDPAPKPTDAGAAGAKPEAPAPSSSNDDDDVIGTEDGDDDAAPVGAPVSESTFPNITPAPSPHSGVSSLEVSAVSGVAAAAAVATFFF